MTKEITKIEFDDEVITQIKIRNDHQMEITLLDIGASIWDIRFGTSPEMMMSMTTHPVKMKDFLHSKSYFGKTITRYAGRISGGNFHIGQKNYYLEQNDYPHTLHGTSKSASFSLWDYEVIDGISYIQVIFSIMLVDKEDGFPGNLNITTIYTIKANDNTVYIDYIANSDQDTLCNITNHTYFNLNGNLRQNILNHELQISASLYGQLDEELISKEISLVKDNIVMDFTKSHLISDYIEDDYLQKHQAKGYDHPYLLDHKQPALILKSPLTKISLEVMTSYPSLVIYTSNYPEKVIMRNFNDMKKYDGITIEPQYYPNSINMPDFSPNQQGVLKKGECYHEVIAYHFKCVH